MKLDDLTKKDKKSVLHCPKCNKEFPAQGRERLQHILDAVRANQDAVAAILDLLWDTYDEDAKFILDKMHKHDRDAILQPGGILTNDQIELLK